MSDSTGQERRALRKLLADVGRLERAVDRLTVAVLDLFISRRP